MNTPLTYTFPSVVDNGCNVPSIVTLTPVLSYVTQTYTTLTILATAFIDVGSQTLTLVLDECGQNSTYSISVTVTNTAPVFSPALAA